jgi:hypothetical protein
MEEIGSPTGQLDLGIETSQASGKAPRIQPDNGPL